MVSKANNPKAMPKENSHKESKASGHKAMRQQAVIKQCRRRAVIKRATANGPQAEGGSTNSYFFTKFVLFINMKLD